MNRKKFGIRLVQLAILGLQGLIGYSIAAEAPGHPGGLWILVGGILGATALLVLSSWLNTIIEGD